MDHSGREDSKLSEVKAVLRRLQGLSTEPESIGVPSADANPRRPRWIGGTTSIIVAAVAVILVVAYAFPRLKQRATSTPDLEAAAIARRAPADDPLTLIRRPGSQLTNLPRAPDSPITSRSGPVVPPAAPAKEAGAGSWPQPVDRARATLVRPALEAALALMTRGRVQAARQRLLAMAAADGSPDVAWALARSYDPNSLGAIPAADARPDIEEAARWYRTWYAAAVKQGLVADSVSLARIIGSMQR